MTQQLISETAGRVGEHTPTSLKVFTGVSAILSAAHRSREGVMHGHTWQVTCWWTGSPDAVEKKRELVKYLSVFDHTVLADDVAWGETLATAILYGMDCQRVDVERPLEGIFARVELATQPKETTHD